MTFGSSIDYMHVCFKFILTIVTWQAPFLQNLCWWYSPPLKYGMWLCGILRFWISQWLVASCRQNIKTIATAPFILPTIKSWLPLQKKKSFTRCFFFLIDDTDETKKNSLGPRVTAVAKIQDLTGSRWSNQTVVYKLSGVSN